ncbi:unnamed protein product [Acanthoscelides obtectus]|uniref:Uncharacterized protein n=1 Tax=Acanthoscelides obtectus TaxID=200917 RepID=A0A9P0JYC4_ACAOB|nr:unnamed protein product [Acanthoscelides obtectus]CAK1668460.1 hypothetical protein AOBTE_LOCUS26413 [Acanthoscelides obtectus]
METESEISEAKDSVTLAIQPTPQNMRRKKITTESKRQKLKRLRYTPTQLPEYPTCGHNGQPGKPYYCTTLTMSQIQDFHRKLYASKEKCKQDSFIIASCEGQKCNRSKVKKEKISIFYYFNKAKRFVLTKGKNNPLVRGEPNYCVDVGEAKSVVKRGMKLTCINPTQLPIGCKLKGDKSTIIALLEKHYGNAWEENPDLFFFKENLVNPRRAENQTSVNDVEAGCSGLRPCDITLQI